MSEISDLEAAGVMWDWVLRGSLVLATLGAFAEFFASWTTVIKTTQETSIEKGAPLVVLLGSVVGLAATWNLSNTNGQIIAILNKQVANAQTEAGHAQATAAEAQMRLAEAKERTGKVEERVANAYKAAKDAEAQARKFESVIAIANAHAEEAKQIAEATAAEAQIRVAEARERTAQVEEKVATAYKAAKDAEAQARKFESVIATANARAEEAKQIAERERLERVKLEAQVAPRRLDREQEKTIINSLSRFRGRSVAVVSYSLDVEGGVLAMQIISILRAAGILVEDSIAGLLTTGSFWTGVIVRGPAEEQDFVSALTTSLKTDGRLAVRNEVKEFVVPPGISKLGEKAVFLLVGAKPPRINVSHSQKDQPERVD
jgi:hypothetical protein